MGDQPGAGSSRSYKIRGYTRERHSAKPYARPPERKSVLETVKDFFSPSWLVDYFKGNQRPPNTVIAEESDEGDDGDDMISQGLGQSSSSRLSGQSTRGVSGTGSQVGNGQLRTSFSPGYFSSVLRERELSSETPSTSKALRTFGLSSRSERYGEPSTSSQRSQESETRVTRSSNEEGLYMPKEPFLEEEENTVISDDQPGEERRKSNLIQTSTPALFSSLGSTRRPRSSFFGQPVAAATPSGSVFMPSSETRPQPISVPKNRPSFSVSAFGSPLPPQPPQTSGFSSPFYRGRTSYGGASSFHSSGYKRIRTGSPTQGEIQQPVRKQIKPKPISTAGSSGVTSQTAKRILEALESMSSPLIDARKIPTPPVTPSASPLSFSPAKRKRPPISSRPVGSPRSLQAHFGAPPVQDFTAPQRASIADLREKGAVTASTAIPSSSLFSTATTTIPTFSKASVSSFTPTPLPISLSPSSSDTRAGGKVKSSRSTSHYTQRGKHEDRSEQEVVNPLPEVTTAVPLPLPNGKSLPSFSFSSSSWTGTTNSTTAGISMSTDSMTKTTDITKNNFKFSAPQSKIPSSSHPSTAASESGSNKITFSFSQPAPVSKSDSRTTSNSVCNKEERIPDLKTQQTDKPTEPNNNLLKKFALTPGSWTCDTCLVSNKAGNVKCVACQSTKPPSVKPPAKKVAPAKNDLFQKFTPLPGSWSCDACMLNNQASHQQCVACQTPKPSATPAVSSGDDLMKRFAPATGSWTCDACMVPNKSTDSTCVACQSAKPGGSKTTSASTPLFGISSSSDSNKGLAAKFAPPTGSWSCDTCMINNKAEDSSCVACQTAKPSTKSISSFGISSSSVCDKDLAAKFAPPTGSWSCDVCMIDNKAEDSSCVACQTPKPGAKPSEKPLNAFTQGGKQAFSSSPFQFGFKNSSDAKTKADSSSSSFTSFKFGASSSPVTESKGEPSASSSFKFGASNLLDQNCKKTDSNNGTFGNGEDKVKPPVTFGFGAAQPSDPGAGSAREGDSKTKTPLLGFGSSNHTGGSGKEGSKNPEFGFGNKTASEKDKGNSGVLLFGTDKEKPSSAAAAVFFKAPEVKEPVKNVTEQSLAVPGAGMTIASAAKAGMLKVPTAGEKKGDVALPPNINLFASSSSAMKGDAPKPSLPGFLPPSKTGASGFGFAEQSGQAAPFMFGAAAQTTTGGNTITTSSNVQFAFGAGATGLATNNAGASLPKGAPTSSVQSAAAPTAPFSFTPNVAGTTAPATTAPAAPFGFAASIINATTTSTSGTSQPAPSAPSAPSGQNAALFSFGGGNLASAVTSSTTGPASQTFAGSTVAPGGSTSSGPVKPFSFTPGSNASSTQQGFPFAAAAKPAAAALPFAFGGSAAKPNMNFAGFGAPQPSSTQPATSTPFMFGPPASNTPSDETMDADGNNSTPTAQAANLFGSTAAGGAFGSSGSTGGFAFGGQAAQSTGGGTGGFNFAAAQQTNTGPSPFVFGAASTAAAPSFGASATPRPAAPAPSGFNFSGAAGNVASPAGFNFGAGAATPQGGVMFSMGASGEPSNPAIAQRKFKRAVRRANKR